MTMILVFVLLMVFGVKFVNTLIIMGLMWLFGIFSSREKNQW